MEQPTVTTFKPRSRPKRTEFSEKLQSMIDNSTAHDPNDVVYDGYTNAQLQSALKLVEKKGDWKGPLKGEIDPRDLDVVASAASYIAASPLDVVEEGEMLQVEGPGYRACVGA